MRCIAVDWSGKATGAAQTIWIAEAVDERLTFLENGRERDAVIDWLLHRGAPDEPIVAGLDFSFSFPAWYCRRRGWATGPEVWRAMAGAAGQAILRDEPDPFWGRTKRRPAQLTSARRLRAGEARLGARSTFQIGGAGAVGTGSIRGMPLLPALRARYAIWPFDEPTIATALELYPRAMYGPGPIVKSRWRSRHEALARWFPDHPAPLLERAAGSEDAFDAAVSALRMSGRERELSELPATGAGDPEGRIWTPG